MSELNKVETNNNMPVIAHEGLVAKAIESNSMEALEKLMDLQERWESKQARVAYYDAMSKFQSKCPVIKKNKDGHNYKYAPLEDIISQVSSLIAECGLSYRWEQSQTEAGAISIKCVVTHNQGHSESLVITGAPDTSGSKNTIQSIGSTVSYLRRYTFTGVFGIATADQDIDARIGIAESEQKKENEKLIIEKCNRLSIDTSGVVRAGKAKSLSELDIGTAAKYIARLDRWIDIEESIFQMRDAFDKEDYDHFFSLFLELTEHERQSLNVAPTKGGVLTIDQRKVLDQKWSEHMANLREASKND